MLRIGVQRLTASGEVILGSGEPSMLGGVGHGSVGDGSVDREPISDMATRAQREIERARVARAARGDREAFRLLVEKYQSRVLALAFSIVKNKDDAEDIAQEAFVKAYLSLPEFKGEAAFYTWLYRIAYNMAIDFRRRQSRRGGLSPGSLSDEQIGQLTDSSALSAGSVEAPDGPLLRKEQGRMLQEVLGGISDEHRSAILLREVDGLSYDEIASVTGVTKGTVMSRLHYARKRLQQALKEWVPAGAAKRESSGSPGHEQPKFETASRVQAGK
jgi:RNA polymerase sigma-70 factor (ECF subfamily)